MVCKHRLSILEGKSAGAGIISANNEQVRNVSGWLPGSAIAEEIAAVAIAEHELGLAKQRLSYAKKRLTAALVGE